MSEPGTNKLPFRFKPPAVSSEVLHSLPSLLVHMICADQDINTGHEKEKNLHREKLSFWERKSFKKKPCISAKCFNREII